MNNDDLMLGMSRKSRLMAEVTFLMLKGAGYAAALVLSIWFVVAIIAAVGRQLPEDSRSAPDPTPLSYVISPEDLVVQAA
jgi:Intrinsic membrane protein PufX